MRTALIGAGQISRQHLAGLLQLQDSEVVAICDLSPAVAQSAAERHGIPAWFVDHRRMLLETMPDVVHVTTPPTSHYRLALDAIQAGAHVIVEKPITGTLAELDALLDRAAASGRTVIEDYNYLFNPAPSKIARLVASGEFGAVTHVDVFICLDILGPTGFADPNVAHPTLALGGGAIADFLPHLASLTHRFVGRHRRAHTVWTKRAESILPYDEFHALVEAERGTAAIGFSATSRPDGFWLRVHGERMRATANLWERRLTFERVWPGPKPLGPFFNGLTEGRSVSGAAVGGLVGKFRGGPGVYSGMHDLLRLTYRALADGSPLPVTPGEVREVNELVAALKPEGAER